MRDCQRLHAAGRLSETQSVYWKTKPYEELYDVIKDPHNINVLASDKKYAKVLKELSNATNN